MFLFVSIPRCSEAQFNNLRQRYGKINETPKFSAANSEIPEIPKPPDTPEIPKDPEILEDPANPDA